MKKMMALAIDVYKRQGQCLAPCSGNVTKEEYGAYVKDAMDFLEGRHDDIRKRMEAEMMEAAERCV